MPSTAPTAAQQVGEVVRAVVVVFTVWPSSVTSEVPLRERPTSATTSSNCGSAPGRACTERCRTCT